MIGGASTPKYQGVNCGSIRRTVYVDWITDLWNPSVLCNALMIQLYPGNGNCVICIHQNVLYGFQCFAIGTYWERCCRSWGIIHGEWFAICGRLRGILIDISLVAGIHGTEMRSSLPEATTP